MKRRFVSWFTVVAVAAAAFSLATGCALFGGSEDDLGGEGGEFSEGGLGGSGSLSGESGAVTLGALMFITEYPEFAPLKDQLNLGPNSQVLLINSEGNTDPDYFRHVVWEGIEPVPEKYRWSPSFLGVTHAKQN